MNINYTAFFDNFGENIKVLWPVVADGRPTLTFEEIELPPLGEWAGFINDTNKPVKIAGRHNWEPLTLIFEDDKIRAISVLLQKQLQKQEIAISRGDTTSTDFPYKFDIELNNEDEKWNIHGAWVQTADWNDLDVLDKTKVLVKVILRFDHARLEIKDEKV